MLNLSGLLFFVFRRRSARASEVAYPVPLGLCAAICVAVPGIRGGVPAGIRLELVGVCALFPFL